MLAFSIVAVTAACGSVDSGPDAGGNGNIDAGSGNIDAGGGNPDATPCADADSDGVCDADDECPGSDDNNDADMDDVPDGCDICAGFDDMVDTDNDGTPNGCDVCMPGDDMVDTDNDSVPDDCDICAGFDDNVDADNDSVPDGCDICAGFDDMIDTDNDNVPDGCDICAGFDDNVDTDNDNVPDGCDICAGYDDSVDTDNDGIPDGCDISTCGNGSLDPGEEVDPPNSPFTTISIDPSTCRWDFTPINQLYCNGSWSWAGPFGCDQADADIFCKLKMDNSGSTAVSWTSITALDEPGFNGNQTVTGITINTDRGVAETVRYKDDSLLTDGFHGSGSVIAYPVCTDPAFSNGLGGFYSPPGTDEFVNAQLACESVHGVGNCCNDGCGSCDLKGFHLCGSPNCNGSVYWNYDNDNQDMSCFWSDPDEILICLDGQNWIQ